MQKSILRSFTSRSATAIALYLTLHLLTGGWISNAYAAGPVIATHSSIVSGYSASSGALHRYHVGCLPVKAAHYATLSAPFSVIASQGSAMRRWSHSSAGSSPTSTDRLAAIIAPRAP